VLPPLISRICDVSRVVGDRIGAYRIRVGVDPAVPRIVSDTVRDRERMFADRSFKSSTVAADRFSAAKQFCNPRPSFDP
jgi:hypothetical protein